jgi:hypothetical protein
VLPAIVACGVSFAGMQFFVSNYIGPELTDIMSSLTCIIVMVAVLKLWRPKTIMRLEGDQPIAATRSAMRRRALHGVAALPAARGIRARLGRRDHQAADQSSRRRVHPARCRRFRRRRATAIR